MYKEAQKVVLDKVGIPKENQPFKFMHCYFYLRDLSQWWYREPFRGEQTPSKRRVDDIYLILGERKVDQGLKEICLQHS